MRTLVPLSWAQGLTRPNTNDPFLTLQNEVNRIFDGFGRFAPLSDNNAASPRLDLSETADAIEVHAELPGLSDKDVEIIVSGDVLTIKGEKRETKEEKGRDFHVVERSYGAFSRSVRLPFDPDPDAAKANLDKGVLTVSIPKPKEQREKSGRIAIG